MTITTRVQIYISHTKYQQAITLVLLTTIQLQPIPHPLMIHTPRGQSIQDLKEENITSTVTGTKHISRNLHPGNESIRKEGGNPFFLKSKNSNGCLISEKSDLNKLNLINSKAYLFHYLI